MVQHGVGELGKVRGSRGRSWRRRLHQFVEGKRYPRVIPPLCRTRQQEGKKKQGIYEIKASTKFPDNWNDNETEIASISMTKRKFEEKLNSFIEDLTKFKKEKTSQRRIRAL